MKSTIIILFLLLTFSLGKVSELNAQDLQNLKDSPQKETIAVFIDCRGCDGNFIRTEIGFVNFVRDQGLADLHLLILRQRTSTGAQYLIDFIDQRISEKPKRSIVFDSYDFQTEEQVRNGLVNIIELGLINYLSSFKIFSQLSVGYKPIVKKEEDTALEDDDPWNNWVFEIGANGSTNGQENEQRFNVGGNADAERITDDWKIVFNFWGNYNRRAVDSEEEVITGTDTSLVEVTEYYDRSNLNYFGLIAKSINDHWSMGFYSRFRSDSYVNIDSQLGITPSIEYSVFPYDEFTRREITVRIGVVASHNKYSETTFLLKDEEFLLRPEFNLSSDFTQPWGRFRAGVNAGTFLHDLSLNRFQFNTRVNLRISKLLSVYLDGRYSIIGDQISLPAGDLTAEELLAGVRQQPTSFSYRASFGFEVQFGSIYNNVVNPRL